MAIFVNWVREKICADGVRVFDGSRQMVCMISKLVSGGLFSSSDD